MEYLVYTLESFNKRFDKLQDLDKEIIRKIFFQLKTNPYVGDQIRYRFFREKRIREKRLYYLVYDDLKAVLIVAIGGKKEQQKTIDDAIKFFSEYRKYLEKILKGG